MKRRYLDLVCPSNEDPRLGANRFFAERCRGAGCSFWENGCAAGAQVSTEYAQHFRGALPACPLAERCTWNVDALQRGEPGCAPRRLGMVCAHQGGEWNTFEMADADDWSVESEVA